MSLLETAKLVSETFHSDAGTKEAYENTAKSVLGELGVEAPSAHINGMSHFLHKVTGGADPSTPCFIGSGQVKAELSKVGIESDGAIQSGIKDAVNRAIHENISTPEESPVLVRNEFNLSSQMGDGPAPEPVVQELSF